MGRTKIGLNSERRTANRRSREKRDGKRGPGDTLETVIARKNWGHVPTMPDPLADTGRRRRESATTEGRTKTFASMTPEEKAKMVKLYGGK